jgi:hypothetical protein
MVPLTRSLRAPSLAVEEGVLAHWTLSGARAMTTSGVSIAVSFSMGVRPLQCHREAFVVVATLPRRECLARGIEVVTVVAPPELFLVDLKRPGFLGDLISWEDGVYRTSESVFAGGA